MNKNVMCPKCGNKIDLKEALYHELQGDLELAVSERTKELNSQITSLTELIQK